MRIRPTLRSSAEIDRARVDRHPSRRARASTLVAIDAKKILTLDSRALERSRASRRRRGVENVTKWRPRPCIAANARRDDAHESARQRATRRASPRVRATVRRKSRRVARSRRARTLETVGAARGDGNRIAFIRPARRHASETVRRRRRAVRRRKSGPRRRAVRRGDAGGDGGGEEGGRRGREKRQVLREVRGPRRASRRRVGDERPRARTGRGERAVER